MTPPPDLPTIWLAGLEGCALCRRRHAAHKASSMRTQPAGSSCLSVRAAGPSDNPCQSSPLWRECPLPRTCAQEGEIPRRARALANRHRVRLRRHRNRRRLIFFTRRAAFQARRRGLGRLGQALGCRHLARYSLAYHALSPVSHAVTRHSQPHTYGAAQVHACASSTDYTAHRGQRKNWNHTIDTGSRINQSRPRVTAAAQA